MSKALIRAFCFLFVLSAATMFVAPERLWVPVILTGSVTALWIFLLTMYISQRKEEK